MEWKIFASTGWAAIIRNPVKLGTRPISGRRIKAQQSLISNSWNGSWRWTAAYRSLRWHDSSFSLVRCLAKVCDWLFGNRFSSSPFCWPRPFSFRVPMKDVCVDRFNQFRHAYRVSVFPNVETDLNFDENSQVGRSQWRLNGDAMKTRLGNLVTATHHFTEGRRPFPFSSDLHRCQSAFHRIWTSFDQMQSDLTGFYWVLPNFGLGRVIFLVGKRVVFLFFLEDEFCSAVWRRRNWNCGRAIVPAVVMGSTAEPVGGVPVERRSGAGSGPQGATFWWPQPCGAAVKASPRPPAPATLAQQLVQRLRLVLLTLDACLDSLVSSPSPSPSPSRPASFALLLLLLLLSQWPSQATHSGRI